MAKPSAALGAAAPSGVHPQTLAGLLVLASLALLMLVGSRADPVVGTFAVLGVGIGGTLQRSRFCFNSAFRDLIQFRSGRTMKGVIVGMTVATAGFGVHMRNLLPNPSLGPIAPEAHAIPLSVALLVGGILFGIGMVVAGGCTSGSLYRMGEGYLASWVSVAGILAGLVLASHHWNWWWQHAIRRAPVVWLPRYLGYGGAVAATLVGLGLAYGLVLWIESRGGVGVQEFTAPAGVRSFHEKLHEIVAAVFGRGWPAPVGGAILGFLNVLSYTAHMPWRVVGELSRWGNAAAAVVGLGPGPLQGTDELSGCVVTVGGGVFTHGFLLNVGLIGGSLAAALLAHEFKWRIPRRPVRYLQSLTGGVFMGYGSGLALGCTAGAFFSAVPSLAVNGWIFAMALVAGASIGLRAINWIP